MDILKFRSAGVVLDFSEIDGGSRGILPTVVHKIKFLGMRQ